MALQPKPRTGLLRAQAAADEDTRQSLAGLSRIEAQRLTEVSGQLTQLFFSISAIGFGPVGEIRCVTPAAQAHPLAHEALVTDEAGVEVVGDERIGSSFLPSDTSPESARLPARSTCGRCCCRSLPFASVTASRSQAVVGDAQCTTGRDLGGPRADHAWRGRPRDRPSTPSACRDGKGGQPAVGDLGGELDVRTEQNRSGCPRAGG